MIYLMYLITIYQIWLYKVRYISSHHHFIGQSVENTNVVNKIKLNGYLHLQSSFLDFTLKLYPDSLDYVQLILDAVVKKLSDIIPEGVVIEGDTSYNIVKLITIPLKCLSLNILELEYNKSLVKLLNPTMKKKLSFTIIDVLVYNNIKMDNFTNFDLFYQFISPLFIPSPCEYEEIISDDIYESIKLEQYYVSKLIHAIDVKDIYDKFKIYKSILDKITSSGCRRMKFSLPTIIIANLKLISNSILKKVDVLTYDYDFIKCLYNIINDSIDVLIPIDPETSIKLLMMIAMSSNECGVLCGDDYKFVDEMTKLCNDFLLKSFNCYEDYIVNGNDQLKLIKYMSSVLSSRIYILPVDDFNTIAMRIAKYSLNLTRIKDRCEALSASAYMFHTLNYYNEDRIVWCLDKCIEVISTSNFLKPELCIEYLSIPLATAKAFKLNNVVKNIQDEINRYTED